MSTGNLGINESLYRALFEQTNDGVFIIGLDLKLIAVNPRGANMLGYKAENLIGTSFNNLVALDTLTDSRGDILHEDGSSEQPLYERTFIRKDGSKFPVEISTSVVYDEQDEPTHVQSIVRDITERKKIESDLQQSEARNRAIVDALPDLIIRMENTGKIIDFSANEYHSLFLPSNEIKGRLIREVWPEEISYHVMQAIEKSIETSDQQVFEAEFPTTDHIFETRIEKIGRNEVLAIVRDISERAKLEQMKTDFINRASHELRTPITTAILMTELLQAGGSEEELEEYWQVLINELKRQKLLIDRFLMAGRLESKKLVIDPTALDVVPIIEESIVAVRPLARMKGININLNVADDGSWVWGEATGLQQVFINLINNSVKYSPESSKITVNIYQESPWIRIEISDQGMGIPKEDIPHLFERFFRARNVSIAEIPGSGLGLYLVKSIVNELDGEISVESKSEYGTTFIVKLKIHDTQVYTVPEAQRG
jgi:PAS domain S-box-containing protein